MVQLGPTGLRGEKAGNALAFRDGLADEMTPEQVAQAAAMATRCGESNFKTCAGHPIAGDCCGGNGKVIDGTKPGRSLSGQG